MVAVAWAAANPGAVRRLVLYGGWVQGASISPPSARDHVLGLVESHWGLGSDVLTGKRDLAKAKALPIALTAEAGGKVSVALVRSGRVLARGSKAIAAGTSTYRLKLPRKAKAGRYVLKATWTPPRSAAITKLRNLRLVKSPPVRRRASASASASAGAVVGAGPRALPDGAFHGTRPAQTFKVR